MLFWEFFSGKAKNHFGGEKDNKNRRRDSHKDIKEQKPYNGYANPFSNQRQISAQNRLFRDARQEKTADFNREDGKDFRPGT